MTKNFATSERDLFEVLPGFPGLGPIPELFTVNGYCFRLCCLNIIGLLRLSITVHTVEQIGWLHKLLQTCVCVTNKKRLVQYEK